MLRRVAQGLVLLWVVAVVGAFGFGLAMVNSRPHAPDARLGRVVALPLFLKGGEIVYGTEADAVVMDTLILVSLAGFVGGLGVLYVRGRGRE